ncbi:type II toxin-antitoxin system HicA family toxin [Pseudobacter ginsenosidimutans]|uniref:HicA-like toxin of HicAB toxin-antitoxin system n=1 Tax=Pseudobacter ginsenosidimutans TaxID=661488 RepID=A0A4V2EZ43_9BACT|nr:addiction module toxin, HicA family [Pseudobacter ginsenosidimutans]RZS65190.1 HicA-like toxin of HicAB toxin-antitoxin system [Pseudobacter ginsenosidimutans]
MTQSSKLLNRFLKNPKNITWNELCTILFQFGFQEGNRKTGGSRRKFVDDHRNIISLHQPHPGSIVKQYAIKQVIARLKELGYLNDE